ncbi:TorF family putative porin [Pseudoxanthomonas sp. J35]|uniref:TorF family putative porin n=1 Tax=Pseudoxanthomonas sp. J35 TaxID=935852 RepID=UPI00048F372D|nr:TorF family putative porin [Pseudoxanthomonas sp. J35]
MKPFKLAASLALALSALPFVAFAQDAEEESSPLTWSVAATSDYVWRGVSQSNETSTGQAGLTYNSPVGLYVGTWASGVDFGPGDPDFEVDYFVGYNVDFSDSVNFDIMLNRYTYPDASELNFNELITTTTFAENYSLTVAYSDDFGGSDTDAWYVAGGASIGLPNDFSLDLGVGRSMFEKDYGEDYTDWTVGVSRSWGLVSASLAYVGTDGNGRDAFGEIADNRLVLTLSVGN